MASCHETSSKENQGQGSNPNEQEQDTDNDVYDDNDALWGGSTGCGYTPLTDLITNEGPDGAVVMFSMGPSRDDDQDGSLASGIDTEYNNCESSGAFFVDLKAFGTMFSAGPSHEDEDDDDGDCNNSHNRNDTSFQSPLLSNENTDEDLLAIADQALMALEDDYHLTVAAGGPSAATTTRAENEEEPLPPIGRLATEDFGADFFVTNFDDNDDDEDNQESKDHKGATATDRRSNDDGEAAKSLPEIDTDAVRRAVQKIQLRDPRLTKQLAQWQAFQTALAATVPPKLHPIIPSGPLSAFSKATPKAMQATAVLSRAATIAEALCRLDLLRSSLNPSTKPLATSDDDDDNNGDDSKHSCFCIDIIGCDAVECGSEHRIVQLFSPLVRWIGAYVECPDRLQLNLIGPNLPESVVSNQVIDFGCAERQQQGTQPDSQLGRLKSAKAVCYHMDYEEYCNENSCYHNSDVNLMIAFHAGIWGYRDWETTLGRLAQQQQQQHGKKHRSTPFVITAYTLQEAEDDADVIEQLLAKSGRTEAEIKAACVWEAEPNAFASRVDRETASAPAGRRYRENMAWQAWRF